MFRMWCRAKNVPKGSRCAYCGGWAQIIEHLVPSLKPLNVRWNEVYACIPCNGVKMAYQSRGADPIKTKVLIEIYPAIEDLFSRVPKCWEDNGEFWHDWCKRELHEIFSTDWDINPHIPPDPLHQGRLRAFSVKHLIEWRRSNEFKNLENHFEIRLSPLRQKSKQLGYGTDLYQWEDLAGNICLALNEADGRNRGYFQKRGFKPIIEREG